jgi:uncharacterized membrane protein (UPF0182 family)
MTIGITGPRRRTPWRGAVQTLVVAAIVVLICLIALAFTADFLVDWLWFSTIGYLSVFWTTIVAEAEVFFVVFMATANILWVNGLHGDIEYDAQRRSISPTAIAHGSVLLGLFFAVKAWSYGLDRYLLLYGDNGVVVGASYTDIHVTLPVLWLLTGLSIVAAFAAWANLGVRTYRLPAAAAVLVFGGSIVLSGLIPGIFQRLFVKPNELQLEKPYIERNIALTQQAYNLRQITPKPFPAEQDLTFKTLEANKATIDNIRLWDWQPLMDSYMQLQEIRTYYKFHDVDVDR